MEEIIVENLKDKGMEQTPILTEDFRQGLSRIFSVPTARQMESVFEFAIGSIAASGGREGWSEGVADGLCRQVTKLLEAEVIQSYWGRQPSPLVSEIIFNANKEWGIRESIKDIILNQDSVDFDLLAEALIDYEGDLYDWTVTAYDERLEAAEPIIENGEE